MKPAEEYFGKFVLHALSGKVYVVQGYLNDNDKEKIVLAKISDRLSYINLTVETLEAAIEHKKVVLFTDEKRLKTFSKLRNI